MAEFDDSDVSDVTLEPSYWDTRSKKAPVGCGSKYTEMIGGLMMVKKKDDYESCEKAIKALLALRAKAKNLPMIKSKLKPNTEFFKALDRLASKLASKKNGYKAGAQLGGSVRDEIAGKFKGVGAGEDMSDARRDKLRSMGKY